MFRINKKTLLCRRIFSVMCLAMLLAVYAVSPAAVMADGSSVTLDIVVYFNDNTNSCFDYVAGDQVEVTGTGTYTVSFDCAKHLLNEQTAAGVTGLNNIGAIYLIDDLRFTNVSKSSNVNAFDFTYDSIKIDGTEVELIGHDEMSGLKSDGQIDTNGPVNAWENCQLAASEYSVADYVLNFTNFENPQTIEITFTVTNIEFKEEATTEEETTTEAETTKEETTEEETTTEAASETTEPDDAAATEADTTDTAETTAAIGETENESESGSSTTKIVLVVVLVIILAAVIAVVVKKLNK